MQLELIPKTMVVGLSQAQALSVNVQGFPTQSTQLLPRDAINRMWSDVQQKYPYQSLQIDPTGRGALFIGAGGDDIAVIQPPLIQIRSPYDDDLTLDGERQASKISSILIAILHHLPPSPSVNFGVKVIYHAPSPGSNAVDFIRTQLIGGEEDLRAMAGDREFQASVKIWIKDGQNFKTVLVEPLLNDFAQLYLEVDAQFPGLVDQSQFKDRIVSTDCFMSDHLKPFIERRAEGWG